jgi:hypothetical protein
MNVLNMFEKPREGDVHEIFNTANGRYDDSGDPRRGTN